MDPDGVILIIVLFGLYLLPFSIILTSVIFPSVTTALNSATAPVVPIVSPTPTTSSIGGLVYSEPPFPIETLAILPFITLGVKNAFFPVSKDIFGFLK